MLKKKKKIRLDVENIHKQVFTSGWEPDVTDEEMLATMYAHNIFPQEIRPLKHLQEGKGGQEGTGNLYD